MGLICLLTQRRCLSTGLSCANTTTTSQTIDWHTCQDSCRIDLAWIHVVKQAERCKNLISTCAGLSLLSYLSPDGYRVYIFRFHKPSTLPIHSSILTTEQATTSGNHAATDTIQSITVHPRRRLALRHTTSSLAAQPEQANQLPALHLSTRRCQPCHRGGDRNSTMP